MRGMKEKFRLLSTGRREREEDDGGSAFVEKHIGRGQLKNCDIRTATSARNRAHLSRREVTQSSDTAIN